MKSPTFEDVSDLVREKAGLSPKESVLPETRLDRDLGITGDDGDELLQAAEKRFGVRFTRETFNLKANEFLFGPEASLFDVFALFRYRKCEFRTFTVGELHEAILKELDKNP